MHPTELPEPNAAARAKARTKAPSATGASPKRLVPSEAELLRDVRDAPQRAKKFRYMRLLAVVPKCFDSWEQWRDWVRLAQFTHLGAAQCRDCTPEYKARMLAAGRCEQPETQFVRDSDGFLCGVAPGEQLPRGHTDA